jgi:hypothetical protein
VTILARLSEILDKAGWTGQTKPAVWLASWAAIVFGAILYPMCGLGLLSFGLVPGGAVGFAISALDFRDPGRGRLPISGTILITVGSLAVTAGAVVNGPHSGRSVAGRRDSLAGAGTRRLDSAGTVVAGRARGAGPRGGTTHRPYRARDTLVVAGECISLAVHGRNGVANLRPEVIRAAWDRGDQRGTVIRPMEVWRVSEGIDLRILRRPHTGD